MGIKFSFKTIKQYKIDNQGTGNKVYIINKKGEKKEVKKSPVEIRFFGNNNTIIIPSEIHWLESKINILSSGNNFTIKSSPYVVKLFVEFSGGNNQEISIGNNFLSGGCNLYCLEENSKITIGNDCMFSTDICFLNGDAHAIKDFSNNVINFSKGINIGNHVWIGKFAKISKNVNIPDNCVVGMSSLVTKQFKTNNAIIAGNPAKIIKNNIVWERNTVSTYKI